MNRAVFSLRTSRWLAVAGLAFVPCACMALAAACAGPTVGPEAGGGGGGNPGTRPFGSSSGAGGTTGGIGGGTGGTTGWMRGGSGGSPASGDGGSRSAGACSPWFSTAPTPVGPTSGTDGPLDPTPVTTMTRYYWIANDSSTLLPHLHYAGSDGSGGLLASVNVGKGGTTPHTDLAASDTLLLTTVIDFYGHVALTEYAPDGGAGVPATITGYPRTDVAGDVGYYLDQNSANQWIIWGWARGSQPAQVLPLGGLDFGSAVPGFVLFRVLGNGQYLAATQREVWLLSTPPAATKIFDLTGITDADLIEDLIVGGDHLIVHFTNNGDMRAYHVSLAPTSAGSARPAYALDEAINSFAGPGACARQAFTGTYTNRNGLHGNHYVYSAVGGIFAATLGATGVSNVVCLSTLVAAPRVTGDGTVFASYVDLDIANSYRLGSIATLP